MAKKTVSVKAILEDVKKGLSDNEIMMRHELSPSQLKSVMSQLSEKGYLSADEIEARGGSKARTCPSCGQSVPGNVEQCKHCGAWMDGSYAPPPPGGPQSGAPIGPGASAGPGVPAHQPYGGTDAWDDDKYCPWEDAQSIGWGEAFKQTLMGSLFSPTEFFSKMPTAGGIGLPLVYAVIVSTVGSVLGQLWMSLVIPSQGSGGLVSSFIWSLLTTPFGAVIGLFINAGVVHVCLMIVGAAYSGFEGTFRAISYAQSGYLLAAAPIPMLGLLVGAVWTLVLVVIGLREAHETTTGKALLAVLLPIILCCGIAMFMAFSLGLMGSMMQGMQ
jgi:hypothetical protein